MVKIRGAVEKVLGNGKGEVGEIDTSAPFQSVKAAVSLFVEAVSKDHKDPFLPSKKSHKFDFENVLNKEAKLVLLRQAVENYKQVSENDEKTIARAQSELAKAKNTLNELLSRLQSAKDSKNMAIEAAQSIEKQARELELSKSLHNLFQTDAHIREQELDQQKEQYIAVVSQLDISKQELTRIRQDFEAAQELKSEKMQQMEEEHFRLRKNKETIDQMEKEINEMNESNRELTASLAQTQQQIDEIMRQKESNAEACRKQRTELEEKFVSLRRECNEFNKDELEEKLKEIDTEITNLQERIRREKASEMESIAFLTTEATKKLQALVEEEKALRGRVDFIRLELDKVKKEKTEMEKKQEQELEQESDIEEEVKGLSKEHRLIHTQLSIRTERKRKEIAEMKQTVDKLKTEAENAKEMVAELKAKLAVALKNAEEAKSSKSKVYNELTEKQSDSPNSKSIKISVKEYEELKKKLEENERKAREKEEEARAQVEVVNVNKTETEEKLNEQLKAIDEIDQAIQIALKSAQTAESAQNAIEAELRRLQQAEEAAQQQKTSQTQNGKRYLPISFPKYDTWKSHFNISRLWQLKGTRIFKSRQNAQE